MLTRTNKKSESGNVLFLILIAVALFAALSYVVTQSTRSGGGSTEREKNKLSSAQMTQYPTALRTAIIRMVLGGISVDNLAFDAPANFGSTSVNRLVFHPEGGAAAYQDAPADLSANGNTGLTWYYNAEFRIPSIGIDTDGTGNELIAFLPGVSAGICKQANDDLGITALIPTSGCTVVSGVPQIDPAVTDTELKKNFVINPGPAYTIPTTGIPIKGVGGTCTTIFDRKASGCFYENGQKQYVYYSVLLER